MTSSTIAETQHIFVSRLDTLLHILDVGSKHLQDDAAMMDLRLAPDMLPLGTQVAFACNLPRGFAQWCAGEPIANLALEVPTLQHARNIIADTRTRVLAINASDDKLTEIKRIGLGPSRYCELPGAQYINEYLMPNFYFHITALYAILRANGVPLSKRDFLAYLAPVIKLEATN